MWRPNRFLTENMLGQTASHKLYTLRRQGGCLIFNWRSAYHKKCANKPAEPSVPETFHLSLIYFFSSYRYNSSCLFPQNSCVNGSVSPHHTESITFTYAPKQKKKIQSQLMKLGSYSHHVGY